PRNNLPHMLQVRRLRKLILSLVEVPAARRHLHGRYTWLRITFGFGRIWLLIMNGRIFDIPLWVIIPFFVVLRVSILTIHCLRSFFCEDSAFSSGVKLLLHWF